MFNILIILLKGIITGILSAYLLMYGLRPSVAYPDFVLEPLEHNWMFIILFIINYYMFLWDLNVATLMLLCIFALIFDILVFTHNGYQKVLNIIKKDSYDFNLDNEEPLFNKKKDIDNNDKIIEELKKIKLENNSLQFNIGDPSPFIL